MHKLVVVIIGALLALPNICSATEDGADCKTTIAAEAVRRLVIGETSIDAINYLRTTNGRVRLYLNASLTKNIDVADEIPADSRVFMAVGSYNSRIFASDLLTVRFDPNGRVASVSCSETTTFP